MQIGKNILGRMELSKRNHHDMPVTERDALATQMRIRYCKSHYQVYTYVKGTMPLKWMWITITQEEKLFYERELKVKEITFEESLTHKAKENEYA